MIISNRIYNVNDIDTILEEFEIVKNNRKIEYINVPAVVDIESSSFYENGQKRSIMYAWVFGINGKCIIGRTYDELFFVLHKVSEKYQLSTKRRLIVYVHNLAYEFQFFRKHFNWESVFGINERHVAYALNDFGIEFRCSYILSGYALEHLPLNHYEVKKAVGDLDYSKIRHSKTPLTEKELGYIMNDGLVVMAYIAEEIERNGNNISRIALTKTGKVRNYCRNSCYWKNGSHKVTRNNRQTKYYQYRKIMNRLKITSVAEYEQLKRAFQGGFTHANSLYVGKYVKDVTSMDFTSSYPSVMVTEQFPMSKGQIIKINNREELEKNLDLYCCLFDVTFINIESNFAFEHIISKDKCTSITNPTINNGRVVHADSLSTTITDVDFRMIQKFYKWDHMKIKNFRRYKRGYLPTNFVKSILELYQKKNTLKGVTGSEIDYMISKENLNSCYGMCVTDICRDDLTYGSVYESENNGGWHTEPCDKEKAIEKYNNSKKRFLSYPWGVWVTAYARRNLFSGILELKYDYIYSDTDSVKFRNAENHQKYFEEYNLKIVRKLKRASRFHHIPLDYMMPKTIEGKIKILGAWDPDGHFDFKTLGAKRYMLHDSVNKFTYRMIEEDVIKYGLFDYVEKIENGKYIVKLDHSLTISGLNKNYAIPYLYLTYGENGIIDALEEGMFIPADSTGKNTHTYIDDETEGYVKDYKGQICHYHELSCIHMEGAEYELSLSREFVDYLLSIQEFDY